MINTINMGERNKHEVRDGLIESGYISATLMFGLTDGELFDKIGIKKSWLPRPMDLKHIADSPEKDLSCYCLEYGSKSKSYWYKIEDLKRMFSPIAVSPASERSYNGSKMSIYHGDEAGMSGRSPHNFIDGHNKMKSELCNKPAKRPNWFSRLLNRLFG